MDKEKYIEVRDDTDSIDKLMAAAEGGRVGCIEELVESGIDIEAKNDNGQIALVYAVFEGQLDCIETLPLVHLKAFLVVVDRKSFHREGLNEASMFSEKGKEERLNKYIAQPFNAQYIIKKTSV